MFRISFVTNTHKRHDARDDYYDDIQQTMFIQKALLSPSLRRGILISSFLKMYFGKVCILFFSIDATSHLCDTSLHSQFCLTWNSRDGLHVNFTLSIMWISREIHVILFMWISRETSSREIRVKIHMTFTQFLREIPFTWNSCELIHVNFTWNFKQFLNSPDYFFQDVYFTSVLAESCWTQFIILSITPKWYITR